MSTWKIQGNKFDFSIAHSINAPRDVVYSVLANLEAYPEFVNDIISAKREGELYKFVARAAILTIPATVRATKTPGRSVAFELVEGPVDVLTGKWLIEDGDKPDQTRVTLTVHVEAPGEGEWLLRMTGKYVESKTGKLIAAFSKRVAEIQHRGVVPVSAPEAGLWARLKKWWRALFGKQAGTKAESDTASTPVSTTFRDEHRRRTLEALATTLIPADDFDDGVQSMGFAGVAEVRARYEAGRERLYATALTAVDLMAQSMFGQPSFFDLPQPDRTALLDAIRQNQPGGGAWGSIKPSSFFEALWEDVVFLYCTHPDTWKRIGFPGPAFETGGYRDFDQPQSFKGQTHAK